jgi:hypothetical protein
MFNYRTHTAGQPPALSQLAAGASKDLSESPYGGQNHQDIFLGLGSRQAANLNAYARQAGESYENARQQAQQDLALSGLQMQMQAQQQSQGLQTARMQMLLQGLL